MSKVKSHKVVVLAKTGQSASSSLEGQLGAQCGWWAGPPVPPMGLRAVARLGPELGRGSLSWLRKMWQLCQGTPRTLGSEAMDCGPTGLFQIGQLLSVRLFCTKPPTLFSKIPPSKILAHGTKQLVL